MMKRLSIFGAGASSGHGTDKSRPPMAHAFFTCSSSEAVKKEYTALLRYLDDYSRGKLASRSSLDIEELYGIIEGFWALCHFNWDERLEKFGKEFVLASPPQMLRSYITDLVFESTTWLAKHTCPYHDILCTQCLNPGDTVISFNYDLMIDVSIKKNFKWNEYNGYGFREQELMRDVEEVHESDILLLKPHGSLNWFRSFVYRRALLDRDNPNPDLEKEDRIRVLPLEEALRGHSPHASTDGAILKTAIRASEMYDLVLPADKTDPTDRFLKMSLLAGTNDREDFALANGHIPMLVMPNRYKSFPEMSFGELGQIWRKTYEEIGAADEIIAVGYSFRDLHFNQLLYEALRSRKKPAPMTVVSKSNRDIDLIQSQVEWINVKIRPVVGGFAAFAESLK